MITADSPHSRRTGGPSKPRRLRGLLGPFTSCPPGALPLPLLAHTLCLGTPGWVTAHLHILRVSRLRLVAFLRQGCSKPNCRHLQTQTSRSPSADSSLRSFWKSYILGGKSSLRGPSLLSGTVTGTLRGWDHRKQRKPNPYMFAECFFPRKSEGWPRGRKSCRKAGNKNKRSNFKMENFFS